MSDIEVLEAQREEIKQLRELLVRAANEIKAAVKYISNMQGCDAECEDCVAARKLADECRTAAERPEPGT